MEYIIFIIFVVIAIVSWIKKVSSGPDNSGLQAKLNKRLINILAGKENPENLDEVKIYDENGNEINFGDDADTGGKNGETVIYDEDGNVMSPVPPPPVHLHKKPQTQPEAAIPSAPENAEPEDAAEMYRDFIRNNGGSAIVIQEILSKPVALRNS
ncbi:MAG: hypothetical protein PHV82_13315 [Victivallaceae bacterium]|nr:hypothetical protein [Victivallaceae bacterium]